MRIEVSGELTDDESQIVSRGVIDTQANCKFLVHVYEYNTQLNLAMRMRSI